jgi:spore photoproduct lyase
LAEEEFADSSFYPQYRPEIIAPLTAADYPSFSAGDLVLTRHRGSFIRPCPATPLYNCCGLNIIHIGQGCHLGCQYCILAAYLGSAAVFRFGNALTDGLAEIKRVLDNIENSGRPPDPEKSYRFCTGEFTDSLAFDRGFNISESLILLFSNYAKSVLELKTKTADIDHLLALDHRGRTVISFSVNSPFISAETESRAAPLISRLKAARKAADWGYSIGLHFDPIVCYPGWSRGYLEAVELIDKYVPWTEVAWISLGCFRYLGPLKNILLKDNPSALFDGEFIRAHDGKRRYPRPLRYLLYKSLLNFLKPHLCPRTTVYLCMESGRMWRDLFGFDPETSGLAARFRTAPLTSDWTFRP